MEHLRAGHAGRARAAAGRGAVAADADLGQDRPGRAAVAARRPTRPHKQQSAELHGTAAWVAELWLEVVGAVVTDEGDDFFDLGGGSLTAAQMVSRLRGALPRGDGRRPLREPDRRRAGRHARRDGRAGGRARTGESARRRRRPRSARSSFTVPLRLLSGLRWVTWVVAGNNLASSVLGLDYLPTVSWWWVAARLAAAGVRPRPDGADGRRRADPAAPGGARATTRAVAASTCGCGWPSGSPTSSVPPTSRAPPGCRPTPGRSAPRSASTSTCTRSRRSPGCSPSAAAARSSPRSTSPVTGWTATCCTSAGSRSVPAPASGPAARSCPERSSVARREVAPGSAVIGTVTKREYWSGSPAEPVGRTRGPWCESRPEHKPRWVVAYAGIAIVISLLPDRGRAGGTRGRPARVCATRPRSATRPLVLLAFLPLSALVGLVVAGRAGRVLGPPARDRAGPGCLPDPQPPRLAGVGDDAGARRGPHLALPDLLERAHARSGCASSAPGSAAAWRPRPCC